MADTVWPAAPHCSAMMCSAMMGCIHSNSKLQTNPSFSWFCKIFLIVRKVFNTWTFALFFLNIYRYIERTSYYQSLVLFILEKAKLLAMKQKVHCTAGWFVRTKKPMSLTLAVTSSIVSKISLKKNQICCSTSTHPAWITCGPLRAQI